MRLVSNVTGARPARRRAAWAIGASFIIMSLGLFVLTYRTAPIAARQTSHATLGHVFVVVLENHEYGQIIGNPEAPYLNGLAARYTLAENYYAIGNPSLPNYLALISGTTLGVQSDCEQCFFDAPNLADQVEASGRAWRSYDEDLPSACFLGVSHAGYSVHHNPFLYFHSIRDDPQRCQRVVPFEQLDTDLAAGTVPDLVWITPNLKHTMHDGSVADGDAWLAGFVPRVLESAYWQQGGALVIVWDEATPSPDPGCCGHPVGGHVPLIVITPTGAPGYRTSTLLSHYSLLGGIEQAWGLSRLGHSGDADVTVIDDLLAPSPGSVSILEKLLHYG
jgi:hypothetical protein